MNDIEYTRLARRIGRMREENAEAVLREAHNKYGEALDSMRNCPFCPVIGPCARCEEMRRQIQNSNDVCKLAERRLYNIWHSKIRHAFAYDHKRWPKDDKDILDWLFLDDPTRTQEDVAAFNRLISDIEIDFDTPYGHPF